MADKTTTTPSTTPKRTLQTTTTTSSSSSSSSEPAASASTSAAPSASAVTSYIQTVPISGTTTVTKEMSELARDSADPTSGPIKRVSKRTEVK